MAAVHAAEASSAVAQQQLDTSVQAWVAPPPRQLPPRTTFMAPLAATTAASMWEGVEGEVRARGGGEAERSGDEGEDSQADAPLEPPLPPDQWEFGGRQGVHLLTQPVQVRALCALLLEGDPAGAARLGQQQQQQQAQQQPGEGRRYEFLGFAFDVAAPHAAPAIGALALPPGPSAARLPGMEHAAGAAAKARVEGVALCWRNSQAFYVPLAGRPDLAGELAPLFASAKVGHACECAHPPVRWRGMCVLARSPAD